MECWGTLTLASKPLFSKHWEASTQHETLLIVSPGSLHMNTSIENIVCVHTEFAKKNVLEQFTLATVSSACHRHGRQKVLIPKCDLTLRLEERATITLLPVRSHSGIDTFCITWQQICASFIVIMLLHKGFTHIHSQIKPRLLFGESFTLITSYNRQSYD